MAPASANNSKPFLRVIPKTEVYKDTSDPGMFNAKLTQNMWAGNKEFIDFIQLLTESGAN